MKYILIRYGELTLKGHNRHFFIDKLIKNIKFKLHSFREHVKYIKDNNSLILEFEDRFFNEIFEQLKTVFGIYSFSVIEKTPKNEEMMLEAIQKIINNSNCKTFKLEVARKDKTYPLKSYDIAVKLAGNILKTNKQLSVDLHNPDLKIEIVIKKNHVDIFDNRLDGLKGLPVGISGKAISMLSGGIDSPVASFLTMKRGMQVDFLHFMTPPHTSMEAVDKVFKLSQQLANYNYSHFRLYVCDFGKLLQELNHLPDQSYKITIMRRLFIRIGNKMAQKYGYQAIITGESLGQVASQTIESINVINKVSELPVLRPVLTNDKEEIIKIAKKIGTYDISILPFDDVCSMFVPKNPIIKPKVKVAEYNEEQILWQELLDYTVANFIEEYIWYGDHFEKVEANNN